MQINWWVSIWWGTLVINGLRFITVSAVHSSFLKVLKTYFEFCGKIEVVELSLNLFFFFFCQTWIIYQNILHEIEFFQGLINYNFFLIFKRNLWRKTFLQHYPCFLLHLPLPIHFYHYPYFRTHSPVLIPIVLGVFQNLELFHVTFQ